MNIKKHTTYKQYSIIAIASIGVLFSSIYAIYSTKQYTTHDQTYYQHMQKALQASNTQDYETALQYITGKQSQDYYNRGTIQTLIAYQKALENSLSGLETSQIFLAQAEKSFTLAQQLGPSSEIRKAIKKNQTTNQTMTSIIDIKTCYTIGQNILDTIDTIQTTIHTTKDTLQKAYTEIQNTSPYLTSECKEQLIYITEKSKEQLALLHLNIQQKQLLHTKSFSEKIEDPYLCITTPYNNIIPSLTKGNNGLITYQKQHQNTIDALKSKNKQQINDLCNGTKNDAQINQNIEDAVQEMLEQLEDIEYETQKQKHNNEIYYKNLFTESEKKIIDMIQDINNNRIENTLKIRGKGNYEPQRYINNIFNEFYGNPDDFIDLRK